MVSPLCVLRAEPGDSCGRVWPICDPISSFLQPLMSPQKPCKGGIELCLLSSLLKNTKEEGTGPRAGGPGAALAGPAALGSSGV